MSAERFYIEVRTSDPHRMRFVEADDPDFAENASHLYEDDGRVCGHHLRLDHAQHRTHSAPPEHAHARWA